ncbi:glycerophosphodiester phosphodiesterase [Rhodobacteraceae bacterium M382]|nr:glycerophosphodiester phosphodiesterase [Rhodobacteraceae bacterium M382]
MNVQLSEPSVLNHLTVVLQAYARALSRWRLVLPLYLLLHGLSLALIAPIMGLLINAAVALSDQPALTDQDIALFLLSPAGFVMALAVMSALLVAEIAGFSVMAVALRTKGDTGWAVVRSAMLLVFVRRLRSLAIFSGIFVLRVLAVALPFALVGLLVALWYLTEFDINYYLAFRPPEFLFAIAVISVLGLAMAVALLFRLSGWALSPHLVLLEARSPRQVFAESRARMAGLRGRLQVQLLIWFLIRLAVSNLLLVATGLALRTLPMAQGETLFSVVLVVLGLSGIWAIANVILGAMALSALAVILDGFYSASGPGTAQDVDVSKVGFNPRTGVVICVAGLVLIAGLWSAQNLLTSVKTQDQVQIIAHRGAAGSKPENTLAAVEQAIKDGTDWVEIDVQESADGQIVVMHDSDYMKVANNPTKVRQASLEELRQIDIGSWFDPAYADQRTPTLHEVLELAKGRARVMIELKHYGYDVDLERRVVQVVEALGMANQVAIMSLNYPSVLKVQNLRRDWQTGVLAASSVGNLAGLQGDFLAVRAAIASPGLVNAVGSAGKELFVWTVNDPLGMSRMISKGVDGIITDEPGMLREVLEVRAELSSAERLVLWLAAELGVKLNVKEYRDGAP